MTLAFRGVEIRGIEQDSALGARISRRMHAVLQPLQVQPIAADVVFFDDNGPKGGRAIRCALTVRLPHRPTVRVEHTAETPRLAFDSGFAVLERQLERYRGRDRDSRRHPKKYFAARRLSAGEAAPPPVRSKGSRA
jgi:ribosome-associated translation inhibitor RaiA